MRSTELGSHFKRIGAAIDVSDRAPAGAFTINVIGDRFTLRAGPRVQAGVLDVQPRDRHALIMLSGDQTRKFLVGHDERHWFVAGVPTAARNVLHAKELLQPVAVQEAVRVAHLRGAGRHTRKNRAYLRQGEWFFIPAPGLVVEDNVVLRHEPIRRGRSKPHRCEFLYRCGGEPVLVCRHYPNGVPIADLQRSFSEFLEGYEAPTSWDRAGHTEACLETGRRMQRNAEVHAKGKVSHPDHATITLKGWHRVHLSNEVVERQFMAFLD